MVDPALAAKMGAAGRKRAEEFFGWDAIARKTERLYAKLLQR
jgi:glycosyltransferase involved in cell wall biosynthesis